MKSTAFLLLIPLVARSSAQPRDRGVSETAVLEMPASRDVRVSLRPVKWTVVGEATPAVVQGRTVEIMLQAEIAKGWHIYSLTQKPGGPIPLRLDLAGAPDVLVRGVIKAPKPERIFDQNFGIETELYSGSPRFTIPIGVAGHSAAGTRKFQIAARYQVCSDKMCLPPRIDKLDLGIRVTKSS